MAGRSIEVIWAGQSVYDGLAWLSLVYVVAAVCCCRRRHKMTLKRQVVVCQVSVASCRDLAGLWWIMACMDPERPGYLDTQMRLLGQIVHNSAMMEFTLRAAFCSLVGSKFAAIVAAGQSVSWLIDQCKALARAHREITEPQREAIITALEHCTSVNVSRNRLVHDVKTGVSADDGSFQTIRSRARDYKTSTQKWTQESLAQVSSDLLRAELNLFAAMQAAVSPEIMVLDQALGWEDRYAEEGQAGLPGNDE